MLIDIHGHIGRVMPDREEFIDVTNIIAKMDAWGIDKTCILPLSEHPEGAYLECNTQDQIWTSRVFLKNILVGDAKGLENCCQKWTLMTLGV